MQPVDFYALPRAAQERFIGSVTGSGLPAPILRTNARPPMEPVAWIAASASSLVLLIALYRAGYGDLGSRFATQGLGVLIVYVALVGLFVFGALRAAAVLDERKRSPFPRGVYLFPVGVIDAREPLLRHYPIEDLANVAGPEAGRFTLDFGDASFTFAVIDETLTAAVSEAIQSARGTIDEARGARESIRPKALAALDPLQGYANPLGASERMGRTTPPWARFAWAIAAVAGVVLGAVVWLVRDAKSDDSMYAQAAAANDSASWRAYLAKGSRHRPEVSSLLLPRAELRDARKAGTVEAIEQFAASHPQTAISSEIATALQATLLAELDAAVAQGTLAAIDAFTRRHPQASIEADVIRARHGVYEAALDRYLRQAPPKAREEAAFMQALIAWAETNGPRVEVRVHRLRSKTLDKADTAVGKHAMFRGVVSLPSHYFDGDGEKSYEDALANAIVQRFSQAFPPEILTLVVAEPVTDSDAPLPAAIAAPTLFIEHGASWHGSLARTRNPRGVYCGLDLSFDALFRVPDATKPVKVVLDVWREPDVAAANGSDMPEEVVYGEMHAKAFDLFQRRLLGAFFDDGK